MAFEDLHRPLTAAGFRGAIRVIIIISFVVLILQQFFGGFIVHWFALIPTEVWGQHYWWQVVTYQFLHGSIFHWLFNMFVLWMFGRELEVRWGTAYFVRYFLVTGIGAALCVLLLTPHSSAPSIGASGAIFGLLVAFAMVFPEAVLYLYFLIPVKAWQAAALFALIEFFAILSSGAGAIAGIAHLGGMLTGYLYLRFGSLASRRTEPLFQGFSNLTKKFEPKKKSVEFHEVTDDLVQEVDRILDKILRKGPDSLSSEEKRVMERYSKLKH